MSRKELVAGLRSLAREKDAFLLTEVPDRAGLKGGVGNLRGAVEPHLGFLGLRVAGREGEFLVSRLPPANIFVPSRGALGADRAFLRHPSIPARLQELIETFVTKKTGKTWDDPVVLDRIRAAVRAQKGEYWDQGRGRPISYRAGYRVLAYLAYQFPVVFVQSLHLLHDLAAGGLLKERMRVLDLGSGPGTVPLAIADAWSRLPAGEVQVFALERESENLEAWRSLVPPFAAGNPAVRVGEPLQADLMSLDPDELPLRMDLIVFANVLNELREMTTAEKAALVAKVAGVLAEDGTLLIMEPADLENSVTLRMLTGALGKQGLTVCAPCTPLWNTACRPDRCWTFREAPPVAPPRLMAALASSEDGYRYLNTDIKFSYALLSKSGRTMEQYRVPRGAKALRLSKLPAHLKRRVNVIVAKMSGDLGGGMGDHVFRVCDGTPQKPVFAVVPARGGVPARALLEGLYGEILSLEGVQVRFNPARDAYNLFVDRSARVRSLAGGREAREPDREKPGPGRRKPGRGRPGPG